MPDKLNILFISAECAPFAKTGGLGDVAGALPRFLSKAGHKVVIVMPLYSLISKSKYNIMPVMETLDVHLGNELFPCSVHTTSLQDVRAYFIEHDRFYNRTGIYHDAAYNDYQDNPLRFALLSKAALQLCCHLNFIPDIIHANDWHTAVIPAFMKRIYGDDPALGNAASVLTIHNIAYQGRYDRHFYFDTGLGWEDFTQDKFEHFGDVNFLKGGIHFADVVNTVSPGYAAETRLPPGGYDMEYFLNLKADDYTGIINGADYDQWNPETDRLIPANYSKEDLSGKSVCKAVLQRQLGMEPGSDTPVIGIVSRLVGQKGFHIIAECIEDFIRETDVRFAILGSGDNSLEQFFSELSRLFPGKVATHIGYDNELAHLIEAGSDFFLMPSVYEPCGLNQIYSLKYGTLPIVRTTGGLNDTVVNYDQETGEGTGFKFTETSCIAAFNTIKWAIDTWYQRRNHIEKLIRNAMSQNFSWDGSVKEYIKLYRRALTKIRGYSFTDPV